MDAKFQKLVALSTMNEAPDLFGVELGRQHDLAADEGAAHGAIYGATRSGLDADEEKQMVFKRCLRGRGYRVLN